MRPGGDVQADAVEAPGSIEAIAPAVRRRVARRRQARLASRWLRTLLAATPMVAGIAALSPEANRPAPAFDPVTTSALVPRAAPGPDLDWEPLPRAAPALALQGRDWQGQTTATSLRRHSATGAREDSIAAGAFEGTGPHVQVTLTASQDAPDGGSLYLGMARRAAAAGRAVIKVTPGTSVPTRFGPAQTAALVLESGGRQRACTGFRVARPEAGLRLEGWLCGPDGQAPPEAKLACALSDLALTPAADDPALEAAFAEADRNRLMGCRAEDRAGLAPRTVRPTPGR